MISHDGDEWEWLSILEIFPAFRFVCFFLNFEGFYIKKKYTYRHWLMLKRSNTEWNIEECFFTYISERYWFFFYFICILEFLFYIWDICVRTELFNILSIYFTFKWNEIKWNRKNFVAIDQLLIDYLSFF